MSVKVAQEVMDGAFNAGIEAAARYVETSKDLWLAHDMGHGTAPPDEIANFIRAIKIGAVPGIHYLADENDDGRGTA